MKIDHTAGKVQIFSNGVWRDVMGHPIFGDAYKRQVFRAAVQKARKLGTIQPYNKHNIRIVQ